MIAALPFYLGLATTAEPLVATMLGSKWMEAAPIVRLLALAMPFMTLQVLFSPACDALGRPGVGVRNGATGALILTIAFLIGVRWGGTGLAAAWIVGYPLYLAISCRRSLPVIGVRGRDLLGAVAAPTIAALVMAAGVVGLDLMLPPLAAPLRLAALVVAGGTIYAGALAVIAPGAIREVVVILRRQPIQAD